MVHITQGQTQTNNYDFSIKKGITKPAIEVTLKDSLGNAIDVTGATVRFRMAKPDSSSRKVDSSAVIKDGSNGVVAYIWKSGDTDTAGYYNAEFAVDYSGASGNNFDADEIFPAVQYLTVFIEDTL